MTEEQVIRHCAPTLASIKTGNLFSHPYTSREEMLESVRCFNRRLGKRGLCILPLRYRRGIGLIYIYRPGRLSSDLKDSAACALLQSCGYCCQNPNKCIGRLIMRLAEGDEFPHEIGLFLGYPPEDVEGFIYRRDEAKCCGLWKVYGDVERAQRSFERYRKCADVYMRRWCEGLSIERLTVAV